MNTGVWSRAREVLIGTDPRQQLRVSQALLVLVMAVLFAGVQEAEVAVGLVRAQDSWPLTVFSLCGASAFYAVLRAGWNLRLRRDRSMSVPQTVWATLSLTWSYAITGPARGAIILIMVSVIMFGMFSLTRRAQAVLAGFAMLLLAAVMVWKSGTEPARYDPRVEAMHFLFALIVMAAAAVLSMRIGRLRQRLQDQKNDLQQALERIQDLATRDELTGLLNRRAVLQRLDVELRGRDPADPRLAVALIDLDHFKRINDEHGHAAGDAALRYFAQVATASVRSGDVMARWGGEEFLLLMPGADALQGLRGLDRLRGRLAQAPPHEGVPGLRLTFSAGVADVADRADRDAVARAIDVADRRMYAAKQAGRDRAIGPAPGPAAGAAPETAAHEVPESAASCATLAAS